MFKKKKVLCFIFIIKKTAKIKWDMIWILFVLNFEFQKIPNKKPYRIYKDLQNFKYILY